MPEKLVQLLLPTLSIHKLISGLYCNQLYFWLMDDSILFVVTESF